jgi:hypothetical protein
MNTHRNYSSSDPKTKEGYAGDFYGRNAKAIRNVAQLAEAWIAQRHSATDSQAVAA